MNKQIKVPFFGIDRFYRQHASAMDDIFTSVLRSGIVLMGKEVDAFENHLAEFTGHKHSVSTGSCTDALFFALKALGVGPGDEVIVPSFSYIATVTPVLRIGAIPVFTDIDTETMSMSASDFETKITQLTKAVVFVHMYGAFSPVENIAAIAKARGLPLIEDTAHSLGAASYEKKMAGTFGDVACFSFDPTKIIGAYGTGGALLTNNEAVADCVRKMRFHGKNKEGDFEMYGYNSRLSSLQAALLDFQLGMIASLIRRRQKIAGLYIDMLKDIEEAVPVNCETASGTFHKFVLKTKHRDDLEIFLKKNGVSCMRHYDKALFEYGLFNENAFRAENLYVVHDIKRKVLSLPVFPEMSDGEVSYVAACVRRFFKK